MNLKVAVVDDEAPIRQWLTYCIGTIAPEDKISTAANGAEALEMMEQVQPDIVFTDICMPVMDGLELMRQAKEKLPFTKFVILTNYAEFSYAKEALSLGAWEYILKSEMRAADIKNLLDKTRTQAEKIRRTKVDGVFPSGHLDLYEIYNTADAADSSKRILQRLGAREGVNYRVWAVPNGNSPKSWMAYSELAERFRRETGGFALVASERTYEYLLFQPDGDNVAQILAGTGISFGTSSVSAALRDFPVLLRQGAAALDAAFFGGVTDYEALAARRPLDRGRIHQFKKQFMQFLQDYRFPEALDTLQGWKNAIGQPAAGDVSWAMEHSRRGCFLGHGAQPPDGAARRGAVLPGNGIRPFQRRTAGHAGGLRGALPESGGENAGKQPHLHVYRYGGMLYPGPLQRGPVPGKSGPGGVPVPGVFLPAV